MFFWITNWRLRVIKGTEEEEEEEEDVSSIFLPNPASAINGCLKVLKRKFEDDL